MLQITVRAVDAIVNDIELRKDVIFEEDEEKTDNKMAENPFKNFNGCFHIAIAWTNVFDMK